MNFKTIAALRRDHTGHCRGVLQALVARAIGSDLAVERGSTSERFASPMMKEANRMLLRDVQIYAQSGGGFGTTKPWLLGNVAYLYSKALSLNKFECGSIKRLNIYLCGDREARKVELESGFADIETRFSPDAIDIDDPDGTQRRAAGMIKAVLKKLCEIQNVASHPIDRIHEEVLATGFTTEDLITKDWRRSPNRRYAARIGLRTGFDRTSFFLELRVGREPVRRIHLLDTRPAPFVAYIALKELSIDDEANVEVILRHPGEKYLEERLFGVGYYDTSTASVAIKVENRKDTVVLTLR